MNEDLVNRIAALERLVMALTAELTADLREELTNHTRNEPEAVRRHIDRTLELATARAERKQWDADAENMA